MDRIAAAEQFIQLHGREIDRANFAYHFRSGRADGVIQSLARFQNADGGFGHALEPDITAPVSNPFATEIALSMCLDADVPRDHPLLERAVAYLERTQDEEGNWRFSEDVYRFPIAPWFAGWTWPSLNPSCTIAGVLRSLGLGSPRLHARVEGLFERLATPDDLAGDAYYAVRPYVFYFLPAWDHPEREMYLGLVVDWLVRQADEGKLPDSLHFLEYVHGADTWIGRHLPPELVERHLDQLEREQADDGGWPVAYDEHWRAPSTVASLLLLKRFGRLTAERPR